MPALDLGGGDPCTLLNKTEFPDLWLSDTISRTDLYAKTFQTGGIMKRYLDVLGNPDGNPSTAKNILANTNTNSTYTLIQFLSNRSLQSVNVSTANSIDYSKLANVILKDGGNIPVGIVDSYIVGNRGLNKGAAYTYSTDTTKQVTDSNLWAPSDVGANGAIISAPQSILGHLLKDGFLLKSQELFIPEEFNPGTQSLPAAGSESLIYLYQLAQKGTANLTPQQQQRKVFLETKNLRFFGAFLAEYCFYRSRYENLLKVYFDIYKMPKTGTNQYVPPASSLVVFMPSMIAQTTTVTQQDYLKQLTYHLACLNTRLNDLRALLGKVSVYYNSVYTTIQNTMNATNDPGSNMDLVKRITDLNTSAVVAQKYLSDLDFHQGVMSYNSEKNRYANILLALYAFLNIAAVAAILQINNS